MQQVDIVEDLCSVTHGSCAGTIVLPTCRATIAALRRALKPHQADIVEQLYGLNGGDPQLQKDVAAQRNLTRARIFQIKEVCHRCRQRLHTVATQCLHSDPHTTVFLEC